MENAPPLLFNRARVRSRRARAAKQFPAVDFLHREAAERIAESMAVITRTFPTIIEIGCQSPALRELLATRPGTEHYITCDAGATGVDVTADEEMLPFSDGCADAVVSILALQWVNDLPGTLAQVHRMLKPDGVFIAIVPGGETLRELRASLTETESTLYGGARPRVAPFIDVRDAGALLQRAGFALPVADSEILTISYANLFALMDELRAAGHANALCQQTTHFTPRRLFLQAAARYAAQHTDEEGQITATCEFVTLTGWKPAANQQQPARRGSGKVSLTKALE